MTAASHFSIAELAEQLDKAMVDHNQADRRSLAAYQAKEDQAPHDAEMSRLDKVQRALIREICGSTPRTKHDAITQAIVALHQVQLVAEGAKRRRAEEASAGLASAISGLIDLSEKPIAATVRNRYFDRLVNRRCGGAA
jgi:hypothetical protein